MDVVFGDIRDDHPSVTMADGRSLESDEFFALQLQFSSNVILAVTKEVVPPPLFYTNAASVGDITAEKDFDGILRRAQAFRIHRKWHLAFRQAAADPEYGIDLGKAVIESRAIVLKRSNGEQIRVPLDENGNFDLADFVGDKIPAGMERIAKPFTEEKIWHMGIVMAARQLHLDLNKADVDLGHGRITLAGPDAVQRVIPVDEHGYFYINWSMGVEDPRLLQQPIQELLSQNWERLQGTNTFPTPWAGRLAVIGSRAVVGNDLTDRGATPLSKDTVLVSKHWNVANSVLTGQFVKRSSLAVDLGLIVLLGCMAAFFTWELPALFAFGAVVATMIAYVALSSLVYINSRAVDPHYTSGRMCLADDPCMRGHVARGFRRS